MPKAAQLVKGGRRLDLQSFTLCRYCILQRAADGSQKLPQGHWVMEYGWLTSAKRQEGFWEKYQTSFTSQLHCGTGMGGTFPKSCLERRSCDSQPFLLLCPNPFFPLWTATKVKAAAPNFVFCPCGPPVSHLLGRSDDICVNIISSDWKFLEIFA